MLIIFRYVNIIQIAQIAFLISHRKQYNIKCINYEIEYENQSDEKTPLSIGFIDNRDVTW